jgi:hypothetical protein
MANLRRIALSAVAGLFLTVGACQDQAPPTGPELVAPDTAQALLGGTLSALSPRQGPEVRVLERTDDLGKDEVVRAWVTPLGATLHLRGAGLTVVIPPGALLHRTRITVRAPAGNLVGYHFEPHGLRFALPVTLIQELTGTESEEELVRPLRGAYFDGELTATVRALEILPAKVEGGAGGLAWFDITHFSGYVMASN